MTNNIMYLLIAIVVLVIANVCLWRIRKKGKVQLGHQDNIYAKLLKQEMTLAEWTEFAYDEMIELFSSSIAVGSNVVLGANCVSEYEYAQAVKLINCIPNNFANRVYLTGDQLEKAVVVDDVYGYGKTIEWMTKLYDQAAEYDEDQEFKYYEGKLYPYVGLE